MKAQGTYAGIRERRAALMVELLLEKLGADSLLVGEGTGGHDYLAVFPHGRVGRKTVAIEVKALERTPPARLRVSREHFDALSRSRTPVLLLVVDVRSELMSYSLIGAGLLTNAEERRSGVMVPLSVVDEALATVIAQLPGGADPRIKLEGLLAPEDGRLTELGETFVGIASSEARQEGTGTGDALVLRLVDELEARGDDRAAVAMLEAAHDSLPAIESAVVGAELGLRLATSPGGEPAQEEALLRGINLLEESLRRIPERSFAAGRVQHNLASIISSMPARSAEEQAETARRALDAYRLATEDWRRELDPLGWGASKSALAGLVIRQQAVFSDARRFDLGEALAALEAANEVLTPENAPVSWARAQSVYAAVVLQMPHAGGRTLAESARAAVRACEKAVEVLRSVPAPVELAGSLNNLGNALRARPAGEVRDRQKDLSRAVKAYTEALRFRTLEAHPMEWAATTSNLANALIEFSKVRPSQRAELLLRAKDLYQGTLQVRRREVAPVAWAHTHINLAMVLFELATVAPTREETRALLGDSVESARGAFTTLAPAEQPLEWAQAATNLAVSLRLLAREEGERRLAEEAAAVLEEAIPILRREGMGAHLARACVNAALVQLDLDNAARASDLLREAEALLGMLQPHEREQVTSLRETIDQAREGPG